MFERGFVCACAVPAEDMRQVRLPGSRVSDRVSGTERRSSEEQDQLLPAEPPLQPVLFHPTAHCSVFIPHYYPGYFLGFPVSSWAIVTFAIGRVNSQVWFFTENILAGSWHFLFSYEALGLPCQVLNQRSYSESLHIREKWHCFAIFSFPVHEHGSSLHRLRCLVFLSW